jgi:hypothetical protein
MKTGILRIRSLASSGNAARCTVEADHIHNLPDLLSHYSVDLLKYYWEVEKPSFVSQSSAADQAAFEQHWRALAGILTGVPEPFTYPPGKPVPDSVELLREDRAR